MSNFFSKSSLTLFIFALGFLSLSACKKIADSRSTTDTPTATPRVLGYYRNVQYDLEKSAPAEQRVLSSFSGQVFVADKGDASFDAWSSPSLGSCNYTAFDGLAFGASRTIDVGGLNIKDSSSSLLKTFSKGDIVPSFFSYFFIQAGDYTLQTEGFQGSLSYAQPFTVPGPGSNIKITSGANTEQPIQGNTGQIAKILKSEGFTLQYSPPPGISYSKISFFDGSGRGEAAIVCYIGGNFSSVTIPKEYLTDYNVTKTDGSPNNDGLITIDFVSVSSKKDVPGVAESFIMSSYRHVHGLFTFFNGSGYSSVRLGELQFE